MFAVGQRPQEILALLLIVSMTTTEVIKREPQREATQREATGTAAPTVTEDISAYPGSGA